MKSVYANTPTQQEIEKNFAAAKKRTCPDCGVAFLTRKDKTRHRRNKPNCTPVSENPEPRHRYS